MTACPVTRGSGRCHAGPGTDGRDLPLAKHRTDKKIGIGVISHCNTVVEPPEHVARLIRKALEYVPPERLVITTERGAAKD